MTAIITGNTLSAWIEAGVQHTGLQKAANRLADLI